MRTIEIEDRFRSAGYRARKAGPRHFEISGPTGKPLMVVEMLEGATQGECLGALCEAFPSERDWDEDE